MVYDDKYDADFAIAFYRAHQAKAHEKVAKWTIRLGFVALAGFFAFLGLH